MKSEIQNELKSLAGATIETLDLLYPGDYIKYASEDTILITKGDTILNSNYTLIDAQKEQTNVDFTLFYGDMRIITTLCGSDGGRLIGTTANPTIVDDVINKKESAFYTNVSILGAAYFCYYEPLFNSDGSCVGMLATVMPSSRVYRLTLKATLPILALSFVAIIVAFFWSHSHSVRFACVCEKLNASMDKVSKGTLSNTVPPELLARKDEFGSMAHSLVDMQASLRALVEQDMLTGLCNRRFGQQKLEQMISRTQGTSSHFSIALGDIDFFKKFNDNYGHDCGDVVLQNTSHLMLDYVKSYGYCTRWGGEEFLIVFTKGTFDEHKKLMQELLKQIREQSISYNEQQLSVTMTFGLLDAHSYESSDDMVKAADQLLYYGKTHGRNCLVTIDEYNEYDE
jgi:diguanylate cyclase (GGDEF)-like protein